LIKLKYIHITEFNIISTNIRRQISNNTTFKEYPRIKTEAEVTSLKLDIHSALEEKVRCMLQRIRCNAYQFYSFLILLISKFIIVKDLTTLHILPTFYIFCFDEFYDI